MVEVKEENEKKETERKKKRRRKEWEIWDKRKEAKKFKEETKKLVS